MQFIDHNMDLNAKMDSNASGDVTVEVEAVSNHYEMNHDEEAVAPPESEQPSNDETVSDEVVSDETASKEAVSDEVVTEIVVSNEAAIDEVVTDKIVTDKIVTDEVASNEVVTDETVSNEIVADEVVTDMAVSDEVVSNEIVRDEAIDAEPDNVEPNDEPSQSGDEKPIRSEFAELGLSEKLTATLDQLGFEHPTPIQARTIPEMLQGKDVLGQAQTGTGKTAAFALPILNQLNLKKSKPQCLVLAPTRELAIQVGEAFENFGSDIRHLKVATICGGQEYNKQIRQLKRGAQIIVGTPGRVIDLIKKSELKLEELDWTVLDEADEMLRMGFEEDVKWILSQTSKRVSMALFSATLPGQIQEIAQQYLKQPVKITIKQKTSTADTIDQKYIIAKGHQKKEALARILEGEQTDGVMVFVKTRSITEPLAEFIDARLGYSVAAINGDIPQARREQIIDNLKTGKIDIIVATDVAARGLDVDRISHVINYDLPQDIEGYIHRIGRTGRAGRRGCSVLFLQPNEKNVLERIVKSTKQSIELIELPSNRQVNQARVQRFHESIVENLQNPELEKYQSVIKQLLRDNEIPLELIAASLAVMANEGKTFFQYDDLKLPEFNERASRGDKGRQSRGRGDSGRGQGSTRFGHRKSGNSKTYRIEIGRKHRVKPGNIVGAIANEVGIGSDSIGQIKIFDSFSVIDLPSNLTGDQLEELGKVSIGKRNLRIKEDQRPKREHDPSGRRHRGGKNSKKR